MRTLDQTFRSIYIPYLMFDQIATFAPFRDFVEWQRRDMRCGGRLKTC